jgi:CRP/FNR family transcriptional regulator
MSTTDVTRAGDDDYPVCAHCDLRVLCRPPGRSTELLPSARPLKHCRRVARGAYLFRMGEPCHSLCAICSGSTRSSLLNADGGMQVTGFQFSGDLLGVDAVGAREHRCDVVALEPTVVCEISLQRLEEIAERVPALQRTLLRLLSDELAHRQELLFTFLGKKSAAARLAAYLSGVARRLEQRGLRPEDAGLRMSRSDLGNYLGLAKETVSRLFTRFARARLLRFEARRFWVSDAARLCALAGRIEPTA